MSEPMSRPFFIFCRAQPRLWLNASRHPREEAELTGCNVCNGSKTDAEPSWTPAAERVHLRIRGLTLGLAETNSRERAITSRMRFSSLLS